MSEELAQACGRNVSRETLDKLRRYAELLRDEMERQNLIALSTLDDVWSRHFVDSAQLLRLAHPNGSRSWVDVGSGAGLPGIVLAVLSEERIVMVEPRRLRAEFLLRCVAELDLPNAEVRCAKVERVSGSFDIITARAVAGLDRLFAMTLHLSHPGTRWILPKGRSGAKELAEAQRSWQGRFRTEPSITDPDAVILVAEGVRPRGGTSR